MKKAAIVMALCMAVFGGVQSQNINWRAMNGNQPNIVQLNFGYDFGVTSQFSYGRTLESVRPLMLVLDYSMPMGKDLVDDFTVRTGGEMEVLESGGFSTTVKLFGNFRRYQTMLVRIVSFGSDFALMAGYYSPSWHIAGEFGFDKSIISELEHSDVMRASFPDIRDGWYIPSGGHYYYGIQGSKTLSENFDLSLRLGATRPQFNDAEAVLPAYLQIGLGARF